MKKRHSGATYLPPNAEVMPKQVGCGPCLPAGRARGGGRFRPSETRSGLSRVCSAPYNRPAPGGLSTERNMRTKTSLLLMSLVALSTFCGVGHTEPPAPLPSAPAPRPAAWPALEMVSRDGQVEI